MKMNWKKTLTACVLCLAMLTGISSSVYADPSQNTGMKYENGMAQPILTWNDLRAENYTNEGSDILRFCVYVETDHDTDNDGKADLVKVFMQVPRLAAEGKYKAATIYNPTPYDAGCMPDNGMDSLYEEKPFDYQTLYKEGEKRTPSAEITTLEASKKIDPKDWNYIQPDETQQGYYDAEYYDYFLIRGFAVAMASGIGTLGSEGFELCGMDLERDSHKCVVEWLAGNRRAFTDKTNNIEIKADWSNGNVAMNGTSYGGTLPFEVATTGVEGLKTIVPVAGIANWYDYTNSQGVPIRFDVNYTDSLAANNCGGCYQDANFEKLKPGYGSYLWQTAQDEEATNGDYAHIWEIKDFSDDYEKINCSAMVVQGLNDYNVTTRHADLMMRAFDKAGKTHKIVLHQEAHIDLEERKVNGELWMETMNKWYSHYLYDVENGIENYPMVTVQSNVDGSWKTYDSWKDPEYKDVAVAAEEEAPTKTLSSAQIAEYGTAALNADAEGMNEVSGENAYYLTLDGDKGAKYVLDLPENTTIYGVPEIHVKLSTEDVIKDGLMITAVLVDFIDGNTEFGAYVSTPELEGGIPTEALDYYEIGAGHPEGFLLQPRQLKTLAKMVTIGWTDLKNPGCGIDSKEYTLQQDDMEAGKYYDYTFYLQPTVYTVAPGHHLALVLTTWDPYRAFLDEDYELNPDRDPKISFYTYGYTIDNTSLKVRIPVK